MPLNVHFIREILKTASRASRTRLKAIYQVVFHSLVLRVAEGNRRKVRAGFRPVITWKELVAKAYDAGEADLGRLFRERARPRLLTRRVTSWLPSGHVPGGAEGDGGPEGAVSIAAAEAPRGART